MALRGRWDCRLSPTAEDQSGLGRNGTLTGTLTTEIDPTHGEVWTGFADANRIDLGDYRADFGADGLTILALAKPDLASNFPMVFSAARAGGEGSEGFELRLNGTTGAPQLSVDNTSGRPSISVASSIVGTWGRMAGVYRPDVSLDDGLLWCGCNGEEATAAAGNTAGNLQFGAAGATWRIGCRGSVASGFFPWPGEIAEVRIYNVADLEAAQVWINGGDPDAVADDDDARARRRFQFLRPISNY